VVKCIAAECAFAGGTCEVRIRRRPVAAIVRQYGEQFHRAPPPATLAETTPLV
jgi:hypothetical protein